MFRTPSISRNLTFAFGVVFLVAGGAILSIYYYFQLSESRVRIDSIGREYARVIASALAYPLWNLDSESVSVTSEAFVSNDIIVSLLVTDNVDKEMFRYDITSEHSCSWSTTGTVSYDDHVVGKYEVCLTDQYLLGQNREALFIGSVMILICFVLMLLLTRVLLQRLLRDPLDMLEQVSKSFEQGKYRSVRNIPIYQEFQNFVEVLSRMGETIEKQVESLKGAEAELKRHSEELEEIVEKRTNEIREKEARLKAILKASPVGIGLVTERRMDWANETMYRMLDYEPDSLLGESAEILYADRSEYDRVGSELAEKVGQNRLAIIDTQWKKSDGKLIDCQIRAFLLDEDDPSKGLIVAVSDVTESNRLKEKLQRAEKMEVVGTLAGGVAHDLNNILSGIVSYPEVLLLDMETNHPLRKPLETIRKSGERAVRIVQDLLTMARRGVPVFEVINLNEVINDQLGSPEFKKLLDYHPGVQVESELDEDLLSVKGSPVHLAKSIMNLLSNGAESMTDSGGTLRVSTANCHLDRAVRRYEEIPAGDYVCLFISDGGVGISEQDRTRIFEPFYTKKRMGRSGTGLGMAVVWGAVKDHGGFIDIESHEGEGTCLTMYLPVSWEERSDSVEHFVLDEFRGDGERILVVDDVDVQLEIARAMLEKLNYRVEVAKSGEEALEFVKTNEVDLLVLDMIMEPGMDGLETFRQVLAFKPGQKAIVASGFSQTDRVREIQEAGAHQYLRKPYTLKGLALAVRAGLDGSDDL